MNRDIELLMEIRSELTEANDSLQRLRGNSIALHERIELLEGRLQHTGRPLGNISANSALIAVCALISTIALCKMAWW